MSLSSFGKALIHNAKKHSPAILTGIGIAGEVAAIIFAVKATPKAMLAIEEKKEKNLEEELPGAEIVKTVWKFYIPTALSFIGSTACILGASRTNFKRNAALATLYSISETASKEYQAKVIDLIGEKKESAVRDEIAKKKIAVNPVSKAEVIVTKKGDTLCYDAISGRYFKSDIETLRRAENEINKQLLSEMYVSLNDFYDLLNLDHISIGNDLGWYVEKGLLSLEFSSQLASDGTPCVVMSYHVMPQYDY